MDLIISDENAMDPEVVTQDTRYRSPGTVWLYLWTGLPRAWALAVFMVASTSLSLWEPSVCILGLLVAALLACVRGKCNEVDRTVPGMWLSSLHHCCNLAALARCLTTLLQYMGDGKLWTWLSTHITYLPALGSTLVIICITILFVLGLGQSRLLRSGLIYMIPAILCLLVLAGLLYHKPVLVQQVFDSTPSMNQLVESVAFFTLVFSGAKEKSPLHNHLGMSSISAVITLALSSVLVVIVLSATIEEEALKSVVLLTTVVEQQINGSHGWNAKLMRDGIAITATLCLSLSLVEVMAGTQRNFSNLGGNVLPAAVARDNQWTGTQLLAALIAGAFSCGLVWISPSPTLVMLSSATYILSHTCDLLTTLYYNYKPSFIPKQAEDEVCEGGSSYMLLSDTSRLMESDSGQSSDTDIDALVHEYKEKIKVVSTMNEPVREPTTKTSRIATVSLVALACVSFGLGTCITLSHTYLSLIGVFEVVLISYLLSRQPQLLEPPSSQPLPPWISCLTLSLNVVLLTQLISRVWLYLLPWTLLGGCLWAYQQPGGWQQWQATLRKRTDRMKLHNRTYPLTFLPVYAKSTLFDAV